MPASNAKGWLYEALHLITSAWPWHAAFGGLALGLFTVLPGWLRLMAGMPAIAMLIALSSATAHATVRGTAVRGAIQYAGPGLLRLVSLVLIWQSVLMAIFGGALVMGPESKLSGWMGEVDGGTLAVYFLMLAWSVSYQEHFFLIPLLACERLGYFDGSELSRAGYRKNGFVYWIKILAMVVCGVAGAIGPVAVAMLIPLSGAFLFVAFKDVYLGEGARSSEEDARQVHVRMESDRRMGQRI